MHRRFSWWIFLAGVLGATAVGLSAWTSHSLASHITELEALRVAEKRAQAANLNLLLHAVVLFGIGLWRRAAGGWLVNLAGGLLLSGLALFCGGIYLLYLFNDFSHSPLTGLVPIGGLSLIAGWLCLALAASLDSAPAPDA